MTKEEALSLEKILTKIDRAGEADWNEEQYQTLRREKTLTEAAYLASLVELKAEVKNMLAQ